MAAFTEQLTCAVAKLIKAKEISKVSKYEHAEHVNTTEITHTFFVDGHQGFRTVSVGQEHYARDSSMSKTHIL